MAAERLHKIDKLIEQINYETDVCEMNSHPSWGAKEKRCSACDGRDKQKARLINERLSISPKGSVKK